MRSSVFRQTKPRSSTVQRCSPAIPATGSSGIPNELRRQPRPSKDGRCIGISVTRRLVFRQGRRFALPWTPPEPGSEGEEARTLRFDGWWGLGSGLLPRHHIGPEGSRTTGTLSTPDEERVGGQAELRSVTGHPRPGCASARRGDEGEDLRGRVRCGCAWLSSA